MRCSFWSCSVTGSRGSHRGAVGSRTSASRLLPAKGVTWEARKAVAVAEGGRRSGGRQRPTACRGRVKIEMDAFRVHAISRNACTLNACDSFFGRPPRGGVPSGRTPTGQPERAGSAQANERARTAHPPWPGRPIGAAFPPSSSACLHDGRAIAGSGHVPSSASTSLPGVLLEQPIPALLWARSAVSEENRPEEPVGPVLRR